MDTARRLNIWPLAGGGLVAVLAIAGFGLWQATPEMPQPQSWEELAAIEIPQDGASWDEWKPIVSQLPTLPDNTLSVTLPDGRMIPRSYFEVPPAARGLLPNPLLPPGTPIEPPSRGKN